MMYNINIFQCEKSNNAIPYGIANFILKNNNVKYLQPESTNQVKKWIRSLNSDDIILFPFYENPFELGKKVISEIKKYNNNIKVYACGPLSLYYPEEIINYFNVDDIIINNDLPFIYYKYYKNNNYNKEIINKHNKLLVKEPFNLEPPVLHVHAVPYPSCSNRCNFCMRREGYSLSRLPCNYYKMPISDIIDMIESNINEDVDIVHIHADNMFNQYSIEELEELFLKLNKFNIKKINLWSCVKDILDNKEFIKNIKKNYIINWNVGIESAVKDQLKRYGKPFYNFNIEFLELIKSGYFLRSRNVFTPLFIHFDPWITPEEIKTNLEYISSFNLNVNCHKYSFIISAVERSWIPIKNTVLFDKALEEDLLIKKKMTPIGTYLFARDINFKSLDWKFKNKKSEEIFIFLCKLREFYHKKIMKNSKRIKRVKNSSLEDKGCIACFGQKAFLKKEIKEIENMILSWIEKDIPSKRQIMKKMKELRYKIINYNY